MSVHPECRAGDPFEGRRGLTWIQMIAEDNRYYHRQEKQPDHFKAFIKCDFHKDCHAADKAAQTYGYRIMHSRFKTVMFQLGHYTDLPKEWWLSEETQHPIY